MIVMKFGGTSLGDGARVLRAAALVHARRAQQPLVVTSALGGVTNALVDAAEHARHGRTDALAERLAWVAALHTRVLDELRLEPAPDAELRAVLDVELATLDALTRGVLLLGECTPRTHDAILARGELLAHRFVAACVADAEAVDPRELLRTDARHGAARVDAAATRELVQARVLPALREGRVVVTGGFVGADEARQTTTLGRGGGDLSATLLGVAADAREVQIWTDVDGLMTADPRRLPAARLLESVSFREASELAYFGARVLHPASIRPAIEHGIPVRVRNALRPEAPGTRITAEGDATLRPGPRAVAWKSGLAVISLATEQMLGSHGFLARVFEVFARLEVPVDVVTTSETSVSLSIDRPDALPALERELSRVARVSVARDSAVVCLVGFELLEHPELIGEVLTALHGVPLRMFCLGASDVNLTFVVHQSQAERVARRLHARFLEARAPQDSPLLSMETGS